MISYILCLLYPGSQAYNISSTEGIKNKYPSAVGVYNLTEQWFNKKPVYKHLDSVCSSPNIRLVVQSYWLDV